MSVDDLVALLGVLAVLIPSMTGLLAYRWGRGKTQAEETLTKATARKVDAEARAAEAEASRAQAEADTNRTIEEIAGNIDRRLDELGGRLDRVVHEVTPNHGGSMKDALRRVEQSQARLAEDQAHDRDEHREWRRSLGHQVGEIKDQLGSEAEDRRSGDKTVTETTGRIEAKVDHIIDDHGDRLGHLERELQNNHPC